MAESLKPEALGCTIAFYSTPTEYAENHNEALYKRPAA